MTYKFMYPPAKPANWCDENGLYFRTYSTYSGAGSSPDPSSLTSGSLTTTSGSATTIYTSSIASSTSRVWRGYFNPDETSTSWEFRVTSDDGAYLWIDTNAEAAVASLNTSNAIVDNSGIHGSPQTTTSANLSLNSEFHYAMTLIAGSDSGTGEVSLEWRRDGGAWQSNGTDRLCHDSRYVDGFGADTYTASASPATPAAYWVVGFDAGPGDVGYAGNSDRTSWTMYDRVGGNGNIWDIAYGKDGSGNGIYVSSNGSSSGELTVSSDDITDGNQWSTRNLPGNLNSGNRLHAICWGNDSSNSTSGVWLAGAANGKVYRSTNGAAAGGFSEVTIPDQSSDAIYSIAANGSGKFVTGQEDRLLISTDDGATWSSSTPFTAETINGVAYTNSTWIVTYTKSGESNLFARTAADSDLTTWSSEVDLGIVKPANADGNFDPRARANIAAADGRVVIVPNKQTEIARLDINGTTTSGLANPTYSGPDMRDITTDGTTWMIVTEGGDIYESTNNGATFAETVDDIFAGTGNSGTAIHGVAASKHLPL